MTYQSKHRASDEPLPTMYDLPSEDTGETLPDESNNFQLKLLRETLVLHDSPGRKASIIAELGLYYDKNHGSWHRRTDWFLYIHLTSDTDYQRISYKIVQDPMSLVPDAEHGFRLFWFTMTEREEVMWQNRRFWFEELQLGLGVWDGVYQGEDSQWLRWYNGSGEWILTTKEKCDVAEAIAERETQRANEEAKRAKEAMDRADRLAAQLRALGIDPDA